jgi:hypothetical protein
MKKVICMLLSVLIALTFVGCKNNKDGKIDIPEDSDYEHEVNVLAYAKKGEIPELPFKLGESIDTVKTKFKDTLSKGSEIEDLVITEGNITVQMDGGTSMYFYEKGKEQFGVSVIVAKEEAFKVSMGGVYSLQEIVKIVGSDDYVQTPAREEDVFFLPGAPMDYSCLIYKVGKYELRFISSGGYVCAASLTDTEYWKY